MEKPAELKQAFYSAKSSDEMLEAFKKMEESGFEDKDLGLECWELAYKFHEEGKDPEKILLFGKRALKTLMCMIKDSTCSSDTNQWSFVIARVLNLLGRASFQLNKFAESLSFLNWAIRNLSKLEEDDDYSFYSNRPLLEVLLDVHSELFSVKVALGKREEAVEHLRKVVEIKEMVMEEGCVEVGMANNELADAYVEVKEYEEAVVYYLKAEEIYMKHFGRDSEKLVGVRRNLGLLYGELKEYDNALELNRLSLRDLKRKGLTSDSVQAEVRAADIYIEGGKYEEAVGALKVAISHAEMVGDHTCRALAFVSMARAYCHLGKFSEAKRYMRIAQRILEKKGVDSYFVAFLLEEMSALYERMKDYSTAVSLAREVLTIPKATPETITDCAERIFSLLSLTGNRKRGIPSLEDAVEKLKDVLGPRHIQVGNGYIHLGGSYLKLERPDTAVKFLTLAKGVMDACLSPHDFDSVKMAQTLSLMYTAMGSYSIAMECQEKVVKVVKKLGPSRKKFLDEAVELLNDIKEKASAAMALPKDGQDTPQ